MSDVSVILVSYNTAELTKQALACLYASAHNLDMDVFIIDNASRDNSAAQIRHAYPSVNLIENSVNVGFGRANNQALPHISSRYVLLLNTDAFVQPDTLHITVNYMDTHPECGILGVKLLGRDGTAQPSCRYFPTPWTIFLRRTGLIRYIRPKQYKDDMAWDQASPGDCDWVPGCYYLTRKCVIDQVGLFDPRYFLYAEEMDHCFATKRAGWKVTCLPETSVIHIGGESAKSVGKLTSAGKQINSLQIESELLYFRKNLGLRSTLLNALLSTMADGIQMIKDIVKLRAPARVFLHVKHSMLVWKLTFKTHAGKFPTR